MSREALDRAITLKALAQAEETPIFKRTAYDADTPGTVATNGNPTLSDPFAANDMIWDNGGDDTISSGGGSDWMIAGEGRDSYDGGSGFDIVAYVMADTAVRADLSDVNATSAFRETSSTSFAFGDRFQNVEGFVGSRFGDTLRGFFDKSSYLNGYDGSDTLTGGREADIIKGGKGDDIINAANGNGDQLFGGAGIDTIKVGRDSVVSGGADADEFFFDIGLYLRPNNQGPGVINGTPSPLGEVVITDLNIDGAQDTIRLRGISADDTHISRDGGDILIRFDGVDGAIRVEDATALEVVNAMLFG